LKEQPFDYYLIFDLEGQVEIVEFPVLLFNAKTLEVSSIFHKYIRPTKMSSEHLQNMITGKYGKWGLAEEYWKTSINFVQAIKEFEEWLIENGCRENNFAFVICGNWDIKTQIPKQCRICSIEVPDFFLKWINIKDVYYNFYGHKAFGMKAMLNGLRITLEGNHHSGLDDTKNISKIVKRMITDGAKIDITAFKDDVGYINYKFEERIMSNSQNSRRNFSKQGR